MPNTGVEEEYYRLRHFSITGKGVINRGDSLKSRRSRSNTSVASSNSRFVLNVLISSLCLDLLLLRPTWRSGRRELLFIGSHCIGIGLIAL